MMAYLTKHDIVTITTCSNNDFQSLAALQKNTPWSVLLDIIYIANTLHCAIILPLDWADPVQALIVLLVYIDLNMFYYYYENFTYLISLQ